MSIRFLPSNKEIINGLKRAIDKIDEQDETIKTLQEKLREKKEVLKEELMVDYHHMEELKDRYIKHYEHAPFHLTETELSDLNDFRDYHPSSWEEPDEEGYRFCPEALGFQMSLIFHYIPYKYSHRIVVECPYCHTKRELGSGIDILAENDSLKNMESKNAER